MTKEKQKESVKKVESKVVDPNKEIHNLRDKVKKPHRGLRKGETL